MYLENAGNGSHGNSIKQKVIIVEFPPLCRSSQWSHTWPLKATTKFPEVIRFERIRTQFMRRHPQLLSNECGFPALFGVVCGKS